MLEEVFENSTTKDPIGIMVYCEYQDSEGVSHQFVINNPSGIR
jgi:hypothetical protein